MSLTHTKPPVEVDPGTPAAPSIFGLAAKELTQPTGRLLGSTLSEFTQHGHGLRLGRLRRVRAVAVEGNFTKTRRGDKTRQQFIH